MLRHKNSRLLMLAGGASAIALCAAPAWAQEDTVSEVVVTGQRAAIQTSQAIKQNAEQIVDSITAVDIGALPDRSVSEALQRIPGVTLQRTNENRDPARLAAEGGGVFVRGLSWVRSETNGRDIFSANNGRSLSFEDISSDLLAGVDVYKNPSADMIEGGVGGIVNLRTRKPFDQNGRLVAFSADYNYADLLGKGFVSGNMLVSDRWDTNMGEVGALFSASIGNIGNRTDSIQTGNFVSTTLTAAEGGKPAGATVYRPASLGWRRIDWEQRRTALAGALQWRPNDMWEITAQALYAQADPKDLEHALGDYNGCATAPAGCTNVQYDSLGVQTQGAVVRDQLQLDTRSTEVHKRTEDYSLNFRYMPNEKWAFSGDLQFVRSHADVTSLTAFTQTIPNEAQRPTLVFDLRGDDPRLELQRAPGVTTDLTADQSQYWWAAAMDHLEDNDAEERAARLDAEYTFGENEWLKSFRFGVRATDKSAVTRQTGYNWAFLSNQYWGGATPVFLNQTGYDSAHQSPDLPKQSEYIAFDDFFRGDLHNPGGGWFPSAELVTQGGQHAYQYLRNTESGGWGWTPLTPANYESALPAGDNPVGGINDQQERTMAAYGLLRFGNDEVFGRRMDGNIGLRVIETKLEASGPFLVTAPANIQTVSACQAANGTAACANLIQATNFLAGSTARSTVTGENSYTNVLPSLNLRFFLTDDLQLRFAAARAMVRPSFSQTLPYSSLSFNFQTNGYQYALTGGPTGVGGNINLKPTISDQFDVSLEWYFAPGGSVTAAAFLKNVKDYIFAGHSMDTYTAGGQTVTFDVTRQTNGDEGKIRGFELAYQQMYDFLPAPFDGLGLQANFTYIDSDGGQNTAVNLTDTNQTTNAADRTLPLEGLSRTSYNIAAIYEKHGISARLAYNWRERYLLTTSAANINRPVWSEDYGQLDGSIFYNINTKVKVGLQVTNLLNSRTFLDVGGAVLAPRYSWTDSDRRIAAAIRTSF